MAASPSIMASCMPEACDEACVLLMFSVGEEAPYNAAVEAASTARDGGLQGLCKQPTVGALSNMHASLSVQLLVLPPESHVLCCTAVHAISICDMSYLHCMGSIQDRPTLLIMSWICKRMFHQNVSSCLVPATPAPAMPH